MSLRNKIAAGASVAAVGAVAAVAVASQPAASTDSATKAADTVQTTQTTPVTETTPVTTTGNDDGRREHRRHASRSGRRDGTAALSRGRDGVSDDGPAHDAGDD